MEFSHLTFLTSHHVGLIIIIWHKTKLSFLGRYTIQGLSWSFLYGSWIYNYLWLCNQCPSPLKLWVRILFRQGVLDTTVCDQVCQRLATDRWFSPGTPVSTTNNTDRHNITEILLKVALNTITITHNTLYI